MFELYAKWYLRDKGRYNNSEDWKNACASDTFLLQRGNHLAPKVLCCWLSWRIITEWLMMTCIYSCTFSNLSSFSSLKSFSKYSFWSFFLCFSSLRKQTLFLIMLTTASNTQAPYLPKHYIMALTMYTYLPTVKNFILCLFNCFKSESLLKLMSLLNCLLESRYHSRLWRINRMVWDLQVEEDF